MLHHQFKQAEKFPIYIYFKVQGANIAKLHADDDVNQDIDDARELLEVLEDYIYQSSELMILRLTILQPSLKYFAIYLDWNMFLHGNSLTPWPQ